MEEINILRKEIDKLDKEIIYLLNERYKYTDKIGELKKSEKREILDSNRENLILETIEQIANKQNIEDIQSIYKYIMNISKKRQNNE